jgi:hypothetical protein
MPARTFVLAHTPRVATFEEREGNMISQISGVVHHIAGEANGMEGKGGSSATQPKATLQSTFGFRP